MITVTLPIEQYNKLIEKQKTIEEPSDEGGREVFIKIQGLFSAARYGGDFGYKARFDINSISSVNWDQFKKYVAE